MYGSLTVFQPAGLILSESRCLLIDLSFTSIVLLTNKFILNSIAFQRAFPGAYEFLKTELNSVFMKGYSIVGDGTTPALTAILTGNIKIS